MRLIDADKLILHLNDYALQEAPFRGESADTYNAIKQCIEAVEEQPTAYDVDKVVEQLEEEKELAYADFDRYVEEVDPCLDSKYDDYFHKGIGRAIKIVKAGAKND